MCSANCQKEFFELSIASTNLLDVS
jgi:hypothetical protein